jgi:hypothetical protein
MTVQCKLTLKRGLMRIIRLTFTIWKVCRGKLVCKGRSIRIFRLPNSTSKVQNSKHLKTIEMKCLVRLIQQCFLERKLRWKRRLDCKLKNTRTCTTLTGHRVLASEKRWEMRQWREGLSFNTMSVLTKIKMSLLQAWMVTMMIAN